MKFTPNQLAPLLKIAIENKSVPFILGAPGIGKSAIMRGIAKELDSKLFVVSANLLSDKADLTGVMKTTLPDGTVAQSFYPHQTVQEAITYANEEPNKLILLFLDEVNRSPEDVQTGLMSLSTERKIGNVALPENISIILAGNDSGNINAVDSATISRSVVYHLIPSAEDLLASPAGQNFDEDIIKWLKKNPENVFSQPIQDDNDDQEDSSSIYSEMSEDFDQFTTPRTIEKFSRFLKRAKQTGLWQQLVQDYQAVASGVVAEKDSPLYGVVYGHLGQTPAANRFLDMINAVKQNQNNSIAIKPVPASLKDVITYDDIDEMKTNIKDQIVNDPELGVRLMDALLFRGIDGVIDDFPVNINAYESIIDVILENNNSLGFSMLQTISNVGKISKLALTAINNAQTSATKLVYPLLDSLISNGQVTVVN